MTIRKRNKIRRRLALRAARLSTRVDGEHHVVWLQRTHAEFRRFLAMGVPSLRLLVDRRRADYRRADFVGWSPWHYMSNDESIEAGRVTEDRR